MLNEFRKRMWWGMQEIGIWTPIVAVVGFGVLTAFLGIIPFILTMIALAWLYSVGSYIGGQYYDICCGIDESYGAEERKYEGFPKIAD